MELTCQRPSFTLDGTWPIFTEGNNLPPPKKSQQGSIENSLVSPGCVIKGHVENSILSPGVRVDDQAVVRNSVLMTNAFVGYHSVVDRCILDEGVDVDKFCYLGSGASLISGNWDVTVLGKGVTVPPYTAIGHNCKLLPYTWPTGFTANEYVMKS